LLGGGGDDKYAELTGAAVAGRDRVLFEEGAKEVRKGHNDTGRLLFSTIINTYPDSPFLPLAKLAIADSFFLEGTTSALIQAAQAYQDWLTFFPTDPLADDAMLKVAEAEMRQMGLSDRDISHARKAEQRLKALLQQYPKTSLRPTVEDRLHEVQENLAMHNLTIARFYGDRFTQQKGGLKGEQSRLKEIVDKYPCFSYNDEVLYRLASLTRPRKNLTKRQSTINNWSRGIRRVSTRIKPANNSTLSAHRFRRRGFPTRATSVRKLVLWEI
jgi:outer membrane protein assembly factor BamD